MKWKFEHIFSFAITAILTGALIGAFIIKNTDLINILVTVFIGALSSVTAFFFTKHQANKND